MRPKYIALAAALFTLPLSSYAQENEFPFLSSVSVVDPPNGSAQRIALSANVLHELSANFSNLRLYNEAHIETPFVIYQDQDAFGSGERTSTLKIVSYVENSTNDTFILENTNQDSMLLGIDIKTQSKDFRRSVTVFESMNGVDWDNAIADSIYDYASKVSLSKTSITLQYANPKFLKLVLDADATSSEKPEQIQLKYDGLELSTSGAPRKSFRIDSVKGTYAGKEGHVPAFDTDFYPVVKTSLEKENNSLYEFDPIKLPPETIRLRISTPFFYREASILNVKTQSVLSQESIFRLPAMSRPEAEFSLPSSFRGNISVKVSNGDNPPLNVEGLELKWRRYYLYFFPQGGKSYNLFVGGALDKTPNYEMRNLLSNDPTKLSTLSHALLSELQPNPNYKPSPKKKSQYEAQAEFENGIMKLVLIVMALFLGLWLYRLVSRIEKPNNS